MEPDVTFIIPLYNEEKVFSLLTDRLLKLRAICPFTSEFILVDDGSTDSTPHLLREIAMKDKDFKAIFLSRNYGHQVAVSAGMDHVSGRKAVMILDGDLQDPPELAIEFFKYISDGFDVVYAVRKKRKENRFKRFAYWAFYRILNSISSIDIPLDSGDFCMLSRRVNDHIVSMPERSRFLRGLRTWVGFRQIGIEYERDARKAGETKYSFRKLFRLAYDGIFNFSDVPLRIITKLGMTIVLLSLLYLLYLLVSWLLGSDIPRGFTSTILAIILFSGVQLMSLGIIGEYLSRIYNQVKGRPLYIVKEIIVKQAVTTIIP